jgi:hypothetical protein
MMRKYAALIYVGALALLVPEAVYAQAALYLEPATGVYPIGEPFSIDVRIDTAGASIGTIDAAIAYDPEDVQFVSVSDDESVMSRIIVDSGSASGSLNVRCLRTTVPMVFLHVLPLPRFATSQLSFVLLRVPRHHRFNSTHQWAVLQTYWGVCARHPIRLCHGKYFHKHV